MLHSIVFLCAVQVMLLFVAGVLGDEKLVVQHLQKAMRHLEREEWDVVISECDEAISVDPSIVYSYALKGNAFNAMSNWEHAVESWKQASIIEPVNYEFRFHLGFSLHQLAQDRVNNKEKRQLNLESIEHFNIYLDLAKEMKAPAGQIAMAHSYLGSICKSLGKLTEALKQFQYATEFDPANELAFFNIGLLFVGQFEKSGIDGDKQNALENINRAIAIDPSNTKYILIRDAILGDIEPEQLMVSMQHSDL